MRCGECDLCVATDSAFDYLEKKLCPEGKAAAKKKFAVYPSAYANGWAVQYCRGKFKGKGKKVSKSSDGMCAKCGKRPPNYSMYNEMGNQAARDNGFDPRTLCGDCVDDFADGQMDAWHGAYG